MYFYLVCSLRETGSLIDFFLPRNNTNNYILSTVGARLDAHNCALGIRTGTHTHVYTYIHNRHKLAHTFFVKVVRVEFWLSQ